MMMSHVAHSPLPRGIKRAAADDLEREQRLSKRFDLLNIGANGAKLYIPVDTQNDHYGALTPLGNNASIAKTTTQTPTRESQGMEVEETPDRIYINDLDAEIAELEPSTPAHPIFLPDIEKHLLGLPFAVFKPSAEEEEQRREKEKAMQIVLYGVPPSLTVSAEQDNVRRAIEEARIRVRQRMPLSAQNTSFPLSSANWSDTRTMGIQDISNDWPTNNNPDDMDIEI